MRISYGTSDVCSSDLVAALEVGDLTGLVRAGDVERQILADAGNLLHLVRVRLGELALGDIERVLEADAHAAAQQGRLRGEVHLVAICGENREDVVVAEQPVRRRLHVQQVVELGARSEEHTSELQSLMRISYAVFCWKKNT